MATNYPRQLTSSIKIMNNWWTQEKDKIYTKYTEDDGRKYNINISPKS